MVFDKKRPSGEATKRPSKVGGSIIRFVSWRCAYLESQNDLKSVFLKKNTHTDITELYVLAGVAYIYYTKALC